MNRLNKEKRTKIIATPDRRPCAAGRSWSGR